MQENHRKTDGEVGISGSFTISTNLKPIEAIFEFATNSRIRFIDTGFDSFQSLLNHGSTSAGIFVLRPSDWLPELFYSVEIQEGLLKAWESLVASRIKAHLGSPISKPVCIVLLGVQVGLGAGTLLSPQIGSPANAIDKKIFEVTQDLLSKEEMVSVLSSRESYLALGSPIFSDTYRLTGEVFPGANRFALSTLIAREAMKLVGFSSRIKHIIVDGDNTLWSGIASDEQVSVQHYGPSSPAFQLQVLLKFLIRRGVLVSIVSKNDFDTVKEVLSQVSMPLKEGDFFRIVANWEAKSKAIASILEESKVSQSSTLFLDDSPYELSEVKSTLFEVETRLFDSSKCSGTLTAIYLSAGLNVSESGGSPRSDSLNSKPGEIQNSKNAVTTENHETLDWHYPDPNTVGRFFELLNKTNQWNLNGIKVPTRKFLEDEVALLAKFKDSWVDHGQVVSILAKVQGESLIVTSLAMSCRVIGRQLEGLIVERLLFEASLRGCSDLSFEYLETPRNHLVLKWLKLQKKKHPEKIHFEL
jgi:FkbH-like protein